MAGGDSLGGGGRCCMVNAQLPASLPSQGNEGAQHQVGGAVI